MKNNKKSFNFKEDLNMRSIINIIKGMEHYLNVSQSNYDFKNDNINYNDNISINPKYNLSKN